MDAPKMPAEPSKRQKRKNFKKRKAGASTKLEEIGSDLKAMLWGPAQLNPAYQPSTCWLAAATSHYVSPMVMPMYAIPWFQPASVRYGGAIKKIAQGKGFCFVSADAYVGCLGEVFLHFSDVRGGKSAARALRVGSRITFNVEIDYTSGRGRARDVEILPDKAEMPSTSRAQMISVLMSMKDELNTEERPWFAKFGREHGITTEHIDLDDESLVVKMELRVSAESGADAKNFATFGKASFAGGWDFEEAVKANESIWEAEGRILVPWVPDEETPSTSCLEDLEPCQSSASDATPTETPSLETMTREEWLDYLSYEWVGEGSNRMRIRCQ